MPESETKEINIEGNITGISAVKSNFNPETKEIYVFSETDTWMEAYVVSSDEGGNFYKELVLQDKPENPIAGILLLVDDNSLFETYNFGLIKLIFMKPYRVRNHILTNRNSCRYGKYTKSVPSF